MSSDHVPPSSRLFGRRKGRPLHKRKSRLMQELLPTVELALQPGTLFDPANLFDFSTDSLWLEIGFGGGEHLAAQAEANPRTGFIGCEPFVNGVASLLDHMDRKTLKNIRIFPNDARMLLDALPDHSVARCFVLFSDPWPKARHAERRFIGTENIARLARVIKPGGELRLASDDAQLVQWMRSHMAAASDVFTVVHDDVTPPADWVTTRYEEKGIKAGRAPAYFSYRRR